MGAKRPTQTRFSGYGVESKPGVIGIASDKQLEVFSVSAHNRTGANVNTAVVRKFSNENWSMFTLDDSAAPDATDVTDTIQAGTTVDVITTDNNDGFMVQSPRKFSLIGLTISQAEAGVPVYEYQYYNGTTFANLTLIATISFGSAADSVLVFAPPIDWVVGTPAGIGGNSNEYAIRVRATTAPTQAVQADLAWVGDILAFQESMIDNGQLTLEYPETQPFLLDGGEDIMPYFGTVSANNTVTVTYGVQD